MLLQKNRKVEIWFLLKYIFTGNFARSRCRNNLLRKKEKQKTTFCKTRLLFASLLLNRLMLFYFQLRLLQFFILVSSSKNANIYN